MSDRLDLAMLLLVFPELKTNFGPVRDRLESAGAESAVFAAWAKLVLQTIKAASEDDDF